MAKQQSRQQVTKDQVVQTIESGNYEQAFLEEHGIALIDYKVPGAVGIGYLVDAMEVRVDAVYTANPEKLTRLLQIWANDHGVQHVYDSKHPEKLYQLNARR